jgi:hypothetical protein
MIGIFSAAVACAADIQGVVRFGGLPVPGAVVTANQIGAVTDERGVYQLHNVPDGAVTIRVEMAGFETLTRDVTATSTSPAEEWELKMLPLDQMKAAAPPPAPPPAPVTQTATKTSAPKRGQKATPAGAQPAFRKAEGNAAPAAPAAPATGGTDNDATPANPNDSASDALAIGGSVNNGAASIFSQAGAFGNARKGQASLYNGSIGLVLDTSLLNANSWSLTGQETPKPSYTRFQYLANFGGPLIIPHLMTGRGGSFFVGYQGVRNDNATIQSALVPTAASISVPPSLINPQAAALLKLYPAANFSGSNRYNYQIPIVGAIHQDNLQARANKSINRTNQVAGDFGMQSTRSDTTNIFGFRDTTKSLGLNASLGWTHRYGSRIFANLRYQFSRMSTTVTPYFAGGEDISGNAGIQGTSRDPRDYGPPTLNFANGIAPLTDGRASTTHDQTGTISYDVFWSRSPHNINIGGGFLRQQFNSLSQENPRGTFTFTGPDLSGFLRGVPDTAAIAFGNADKYLRASGWNLYIKDDWRASPGLTWNLGLRWEYSAPPTELYGRLVNLDIASGWSAVAPVVASNPVGQLTGRTYPSSLLYPDRSAIQPRVGFAWRPMGGGSLVVRGGYGLYYDTSVYQSITIRMTQQEPLSRSLSIQNTAATPLTLATAFLANAATPNTFAVDPNFRIGFAHTFQLSAQRDLPGSLVAIATWNATKGTRGKQQFLPNTYPTGSIEPTGYVYLASNGNSTRQSGQIQLRRRLHKGITASAQYTWSRSMDDAALGGRNQAGALIAQNWLDLSAERALSNFDQRHLLNFTGQYSTGTGVRNGWRSTAIREWTITTQITAGSGLPLSPVYLSPVQGTGVTGTIRPNYTGASLYDPPPGFYLNPAAVTAPTPGQWGNAGRNSITGPNQFSLNASLSRTFRFRDRYNADLRIDATNALNHVTFPSWNVVANSAQFGLPPGANPMRSLQTTLRVRF